MLAGLKKAQKKKDKKPAGKKKARKGTDGARDEGAEVGEALAN